MTSTDINTSTNDRKVAGSRPTKVVCITVLTGKRMGWTARCGRPPLLLPSCRKLEFRLSALMDSDMAWVNGKSGRQNWRYADAFQRSIYNISETIYHLPYTSLYGRPYAYAWTSSILGVHGLCVTVVPLHGTVCRRQYVHRRHYQFSAEDWRLNFCVRSYSCSVSWASHCTDYCVTTTWPHITVTCPCSPRTLCHVKLICYHHHHHPVGPTVSVCMVVNRDWSHKSPYMVVVAI